jgi:hypothetical protein
LRIHTPDTVNAVATTLLVYTALFQFDAIQVTDW